MRREEIPICNKCGESTAAQYMNCEDGFDSYGTKVVAAGAYASPVLHDCVRYTFLLCEPCIAGIMRSLLVPPVVTSHTCSGDILNKPQVVARALGELGFEHVAELVDVAIQN